MWDRSEEHTSELQSLRHLVFRLSFPTRRSSDLFPTAQPGRASPCFGQSQTSGLCRPSDVRAETCGTDRKSTRLNSSHLGISYFVFLSLHDALPIYFQRLNPDAHPRVSDSPKRRVCAVLRTYELKHVG